MLGTTARICVEHDIALDKRVLALVCGGIPTESYRALSHWGGGVTNSNLAIGVWHYFNLLRDALGVRKNQSFISLFLYNLL